jgi:excinuclease ABC subunit B
MSRDELLKNIAQLEKKMRQAASELQFELAAQLRDEIIELKKMSLL